MATKTLSVDVDAYLLLMRAKKDAKESFSKVIKRARWDESSRTCESLLARAQGRVREDVLDRLDRAQREDAPPAEPWHR